jgi:hypothetical protein
MDSVVGCDVRRDRIGGVVKRVAFNIYVACNMLVCSIVFAPWALPRETVSGLLGRWASTERGLKRRFGMCAGSVVDVIYFWEPNHCYETFKIERKAREILYP